VTTAGGGEGPSPSAGAASAAILLPKLTVMRPVALAASLFSLAALAAAQQHGPVLDPAALVPGTTVHRCGTPSVVVDAGIDNPDCDATRTNPTAAYAPGTVWRIPVVVHVIQNTSGQGALTDALVQSQIAILNEDFRALPGTPGAGGFDTRIEFFLATTSPTGAATTGIVRYTNNTWFTDSGSYWNTIAWNPQRYMNIYTNSAGGGGVLGYVPTLPQNGVAGTTADRIVILWSAFGRNALGGPPFNQGRTCTHEVGHYLGLYHTFQGGCGTTSCYTTGDTICDTSAEANPRFGCPTGATSCGTPDPYRNFMDYTDDTCMTAGFTSEQARRMRCTLQSYRPQLYQLGGQPASAAIRPGAGNLNDKYTCTAPRIGQSVSASVLTFGTGATAAAVYGYLAAATVPYNGYTILVDTNSPQLLQLPITFNSLVCSWSFAIPNNSALNGLPVKTQGVLLGSTLALTNAVDLVIGS